LLGSDGEYLLDSGQPELDRSRAERFGELFKERHELLPNQDGSSYRVVLGKRSWPFAVPITKGESGWVFDANAGKEEVLLRRIGENEFAAIDTARLIYAAQREYASRDWDQDGALRYASRIVSSPGKRDGLYWPATAEIDELSPLGPTVARASLEDYLEAETSQTIPFKGYNYTMIYSPSHSSTPNDVLTRPGQYWLIATPIKWSESGVMTFAANERGWLYEKDLGGDFDYSDAKSLAVDQSWTRVE
jgi:hypothetical protein